MYFYILQVVSCLIRCFRLSIVHVLCNKSKFYLERFKVILMAHNPCFDLAKVSFVFFLC